MLQNILIQKYVKWCTPGIMLGRIQVTLFIILGLFSIQIVTAQSSVDSSLQSLSTEPAAIMFAVDEYKVLGFNPFSKRKTRRILKPYTGHFNSLDTIFDAVNALEKAIHETGYTLTSVVLPEQPVSNNIIELQVQGYSLFSTEVVDNKYFSETNIRRTARSLQIGEHTNMNKLTKSLAVANLHPSKRVNVKFISQNKDSDTVDANLNVRDQSPRQFFSWLNNTGNEETGDFRLGVGFQHSNVFGRDHIATLTYTTSPDHVKNVTQVGFSYKIPMYRAGGFFDFAAFDSDIDTGTVADVFDVSGKGQTIRLGYTQLLKKRGAYSHQLYTAIEDKLFDNEVRFDGVELVPDIRSRPLTLGYRNKWTKNNTQVTNDISTLFNLSGGDLNTIEDYLASRSGANQDWRSVRYSGSFQLPIKKFRLSGSVKAQYANEPLITGEQFGIGGQDSIRGFRDRVLIGDKGYSLSLQLWLPSLKQFNFLGFFEYGKIEREQALEGELASKAISSVGIGMRWTSANSKWNIKFDIGHILDGLESNASENIEDGDNRAHITIVHRN